MKMRFGGLAAAALVAFAAPAGAIPLTYTYQYTFNGSQQPTGGSTVTTNGNTVTNVGNSLNVSDASSPSGNPTLNAHVTAYSKTTTGDASGTITTAKLANYAGSGSNSNLGGLGVTNRNETNSSPSHTVDNNSGTDFIVFEFSDKVRLTNAILDLFQDGYGLDGDITIGYVNDSANPNFTSSSLPFANGATFSSLGITTFQSNGAASYPGIVTEPGFQDARYADFTSLTNIEANTWIIMADMTLGPNDWYGFDDFKLSGITVTKTVDNQQQTGSVPEPATWAMMIAGFGFVGASMRRRNRQVVKAVA